MLNDFIAKQDINLIKKIEIYGNRILFPIKIDSNSFYKEFNTEIISDNFTTEKALFVASKYDKNKSRTSMDLLNAKIRF